MPTTQTSETSIRDRLERLVAAGIRIHGERSLERVLHQIVDSGREVIEARYAALGILADHGKSLEQFVTSGISDEEAARIGQLPQGRGLLGVVIDNPEPIRLREVSEHPKSVGFPPNHPPIRSFLGVPIVGRDGPIGNLYLGEKQGSDEFSEEDESIAVMLAAQAAVAVENAKLDEEAHRLLSKLTKVQQLRDRFYAMMSHELRNALMAVHGWADLFLRSYRNEPPRAAREAYESAEDAIKLLNDLLDLSRLDANRLQIVPRPADAWDLVEDAVNAVEPTAGRAGVGLRTPAKKPSCPCRTDATRVRQVLVNLLSNAVRFSPEGKAVKISLRSASDALTFEVVDRGPGIPPEDHEAIFEEFYQANHRDARDRGTGLGLSLSRRLARLLGGDVRVHSKPGSGSRFTFEIARDLGEE
jgi:signal transduction histidine kinase